MDGEDGLTQPIPPGSQDERPEIGYGSGDFVQKLLEKAQFRDEGTLLQSPTPVRQTGRLGHQRNRRTSKEREMALLALRMPPRTNSIKQRQTQQQDSPSLGPVTRSRSSQNSSGVPSSPSNGSTASRSLSSPSASLDDSTETLFGAIPPTPPLANNTRLKNTKNCVMVAMNVQKKSENSTATFGTSNKECQPRTPQNQRVLSFSNGISSNKRSTPVSTPTVGSRAGLRGQVLLAQSSPVSCSQPTPPSVKAQRSRGRCRSQDKRLLESICSNDEVLSPNATGLAERVSVSTQSKTGPLAENANGCKSNEAAKSGPVDDSWDEDDFLSQIASQVEKKFMQQPLPTSAKRSPRSTSGGSASSATVSKTRTPRKKKLKDTELTSVAQSTKQTNSKSISVERNRPLEPVVMKKRSPSDTATSGVSSQSSTSSGELKRVYTEEEISRKRQAALQKRQLKLNAK